MTFSALLARNVAKYMIILAVIKILLIVTTM